jgi:hypothetical protein
MRSLAMRTSGSPLRHRGAGGLEHLGRRRVLNEIQVVEAALGFGVLELHHDRRAPAL